MSDLFQINHIVFAKISRNTTNTTLTFNYTVADNRKFIMSLVTCFYGLNCFFKLFILGFLTFYVLSYLNSFFKYFRVLCASLFKVDSIYRVFMKYVTQKGVNKV